MKKGFLFVTAVALMAASCTGSKQAQPAWKVSEFKIYDGSSTDDGYNVYEFSYDEDGRLCGVTADGYEADGSLCWESCSYVEYSDDKAVVKLEYGNFNYFYAKGLIDKQVCDWDEGEVEEHYNYKNGLLVDSWNEGGEIGGSAEYEWQDGNIIIRSDYADGCSLKRQYSYSANLDNYIIDIISFVDDCDIRTASLPGGKAMRSRCLPSSEVQYDLYINEDGEEVNELSVTNSYEYESDELGRVTKIVKTSVSEEWASTRTIEVSYAE